MNNQITRNNHYVPKWYQRGFLEPLQSKLHVLDMAPEDVTLPNGRVIPGSPLSECSPRFAFSAFDLYTTRFGDDLNDEVERLLFGPIDKSGAEAVRALIDNNPLRVHNYFSALFDFLDTQKLRTPKGLDFLLERYGQIGQTALMVEMQRLRDMHCTIWTEGVREVVSAKNSSVKFLVSDHPVTIYHREFPPDASICDYPNDPGVELVGSQTIYALDGNHCLILTHTEYAKSPSTVDVLATRTHARFRGHSYVRTDAFIRARELSSTEVTAINTVLKSRARRYVASAKVEWLYPEHSNSLSWREIEQVLLPRDDLWRFGGETIIAFKDGTYHYQDAFGRTSKAHEYLAKTPPKNEPDSSDDCPCGSGHLYVNCCKPLPVHERPTWTSYGIRERNIALCNAVADILGLNEGRDWDHVRRELNDDHVRRIHEIFESLWPRDTLLRELLPRPKENIFRAVFLGLVDPRTLPFMATGWLNYFDELVLPHPFPNPAGLRPDYSPTKSPTQYREQTLRNVLMLLQLESFIRAGKVHLIPDPTDVDEFYRAEVLASAKQESESVELSARDKQYADVLAKDEHKRWRLRAEAGDLAAFVKRSMPDIAPDMLAKVTSKLKRELEDDPLTLLQPLKQGASGGQLMMAKSFGIGSGLFIASMTGSVPYCHMDAIWQRLHASDGERTRSENEPWRRIVGELKGIAFPLYLPDSSEEWETPADAGDLREVLRLLARAARSSNPEDIARLEATMTAIRVRGRGESSSGILAHFEASSPDEGFLTRDAIRLLHTYGIASRINPVPLALLLKLEN